MSLLSVDCGCDTKTFTADAVINRRDPTGCNHIRNRWRLEATRRWRAIQNLITRSVVKLDVFGIQSSKKDSDIVLGILAHSLNGASFVHDAVRIPRQFEFKHSGTKAGAFMNWLKQEMDAGVLGISQGAGAQSNAPWQNTYIDSAYQKGIRDGYGRVDKPTSKTSILAGFNRPIHAAKVASIYTRTYEELAGVTRATATAISETLARGLAEGRGPIDIARSLNDRVSKIGIARSELIARTEVTAAHAEATLNAYRETGMEDVSILAEFSTAGDDNVCPDCEELEGKEFGIEEASGMIPVHPNCRCTFLPVV